MGSNQIFSYTALGDNMNLGARLESLCKFYGVQLNISEYTKNALPPELAAEFIFRTLDKVRVKGKENALTIYEVLHPSHHLYNEKEALALYEESFAMYLIQNFKDAAAILKTLHEKYPEDKTFDRMLHICVNFLEIPPPAGWDGTYTHKSK
jgi:adenylate cyclase